MHAGHQGLARGRIKRGCLLLGQRVEGRIVEVVTLRGLIALLARVPATQEVGIGADTDVLLLGYLKTILAQQLRLRLRVDALGLDRHSDRIQHRLQQLGLAILRIREQLQREPLPSQQPPRGGRIVRILLHAR